MNTNRKNLPVWITPFNSTVTSFIYIYIHTHTHTYINLVRNNDKKNSLFHETRRTLKPFVCLLRSICYWNKRCRKSDFTHLYKQREVLCSRCGGLCASEWAEKYSQYLKQLQKEVLDHTEMCLNGESVLLLFDNLVFQVGLWWVSLVPQPIPQDLWGTACLNKLEI